MNAIFLGDSPEAERLLTYILETKVLNIVAVFTGADSVRGRNQSPTPSNVKKLATLYNIPVYHHKPKNTEKDSIYTVVSKETGAEIGICKAYGHIIPEDILEYLKYGIVNLHYSLLPKYRGAVPVNKAIIDGETETGVTYMLIAKGLDTGDIIQQFKIPIEKTDNTESLKKKLTNIVLETFEDTIKKYLIGEYKPYKQSELGVTICKESDISKNLSYLNKSRSSNEAERIIRGFYPWPIARVRIYSDEILVYKAEVIEDTRYIYTIFKTLVLKNIKSLEAVNILPTVTNHEITTLSSRLQTEDPTNTRKYISTLELNIDILVSDIAILLIKDKFMIIFPDLSVLSLLEVQLTGKKRLDTKSFLNGYLTSLVKNKK